MKHKNFLTDEQQADLVKQYKAEAKLLNALHEKLSTSPDLQSALFATANYNVRCCFKDQKTLNGLHDALKHEYWNKIFNNSYFWDWVTYTNGVRGISDRETLLKPYQLANNCKDFSKYQGYTLPLVDFNLKNIKAFNAEYLNLSNERVKHFLNTILKRCGAGKTVVTEFKNKLTYQLGDSVWERASDIKNLLAVIEHVQGKDFKPVYDTLNLELSHKMIFEWLNGAVTLEKHLNGNGTLKISANIVPLLNAALNA